MKIRRTSCLRPAFGWVAFALLVGVLSQRSVARPPAPRLLPAETLAYLRVADVPEMIAQFQESTLGRIAQDEQVRPLVAHVWEALLEAAGEMEEALGVTPEELLAIPEGEIALALVAPEEMSPALVLVLDADLDSPTVRHLLDRLETSLAEQGTRRRTQRSEGSEMVIHQHPQANRELSYLQKEGTLILSNSVQATSDLLAAWEGQPNGRQLSDNSAYAAIMKRCAGELEEPPTGAFFVDALELTRRAARGSVPGQVFLALLNPLGLDGIRGIGGSLSLVTEQYDNLLNVHLLLERPRRGVFEVTALQGGDITPEGWVPRDAVSYTSLRWDMEKGYPALRELYDAIRGEGALRRDVDQSFSIPLGIDFEQEFLAAITGRMSHIGWMVRPARLNSRANLVGFQVKDPARFRNTWLKLTEHLGASLERKSWGMTEYWQLTTTAPPSQAPGQELVRQPDPAFALLGDYLLISDSSELLRQAVITQSDASLSLGHELDYKLIASRIRRQHGGQSPGLFSFDRPEESMRLLYELAVAETTRDQLAAQGPNNPFFGALDGALREHPLPPFSVIARYLAPGGSLLTNEETGFHFTRFTLRRQ